MRDAGCGTAMLAFSAPGALSGMPKDCDVPGYEQWFDRVPTDIKRDPVWHLTVYRLARFASDRAWRDVTTLTNDRRTREIASQLWRSLGAISADIVEGYSRSSGRDRVRFYEYALGSAREAREWYLQTAPILHPERMRQAIELLSRVIRLLATYIRISENGPFDRSAGHKASSPRISRSPQPVARSPIIPEHSRPVSG